MLYRSGNDVSTEFLQQKCELKMLSRSKSVGVWVTPLPTPLRQKPIQQTKFVIY
jgi:hypothetical protein